LPQTDKQLSADAKLRAISRQALEQWSDNLARHLLGPNELAQPSRGPD